MTPGWHLMVLYSFFIADTAGKECEAGVTGTTCHKQNIALNKTAFQSDTHHQYNASLAVDGNTITDHDQGHCSHTENTTDVFWTVTLNDKIQYNISQFTLYLRNKHADRYKTLRILVNGKLCKNIPISGGSGPPDVNPVIDQCNQTLEGNIVTVRVDNNYLSLCEVQIWVCSDGWFGVDCRNDCKCRNTSEICDKETGYCRSGCAKGYHGDGCQTACGNKTYGFNCAQRCGKCRSVPCDHVTGVCSDGCEPGYNTSKCDKTCRSNTYGDNCSLPCGQCKDSSACHHVTGVCGRGCEDGWRPGKCDMGCCNGTYGENCASDCGQCFDNDVCDTVNGACPGGCLDGYVPPLCTKCIDGMFGSNCSTECGNCNMGNQCDKVTGRCKGGCKPGFMPPLCKECTDGMFGSNCSTECGNCSTGNQCDKVTGRCNGGCKPGFMPPLCKVCIEGSFGADCELKCKCENTSEICDKETGYCRSGCVSGDGCQTECADGLYGDGCSSICGNCNDGNVCDKVNGSCPDGCQNGFWPTLCKECDVGFYGDCSLKCGHCRNNANCDNVSGSCPNGCQDGYIPPFCQVNIESAPAKSTSVVVIVGGVVAAVVVLVAVGLGTMFILRRKEARQKGQQGNHVFENSQFQNSEELNDPDLPQESQSHDNPNVEHYYNNIPANIPLDFLKEHVRKNIAQGGFESEYKMIRHGLHGKHEIGKMPENKPRNRYRDLLPYDHSRVKLVPDGASMWDYINASFVSGYSDDTTFIAAQGPNPVTVDDFWRMVWQQNVRKILMLTRLMEMNKKKCEQYWPEGHEAMQCGNITIQTTFSTVRADYTIRTFKIQHTNSPKRTVTQFHFTTWPDHGVPAAPALVGFWKQVKLTDTQTDEEAGPLVVHCSAGVGRTGTFIALDCLVTQAETENKVNVFMFVAKMREARMNLVQTEKQYQFVYEALVEALESRGTFYTLSEFDLMYGNDRTYTSSQKEELRGQFKSLQSLKTDLSERLVTDSLLPENVKKNRSEEILPPNRSRPFLMTTASGCNDYINAVMLPSAIRSNFYIVTQTPLPETVVDFWRLVYDHDCYIIVCLDDSKDAMSLYPREMTSSTVGPFNVETQSELRTRDNYVFMKMTISHKDEVDSKREIEVYRFAAMDTTSGHLDSGAILEFINDLHSNSIGDDQKMLIHCFDGSRVSGVFCSIMNIVSRLRLDKEVDIFLTIRELQTVRPQFVQTYEQYKLCHDMVKEYSRSSNIYANM